MNQTEKLPEIYDVLFREDRGSSIPTEQLLEQLLEEKNEIMDLQDSINKQLISAEMREILNDDPELSREVKDLLHNQVERKLKERQLLSPENSNELWQAIAWFSQRGDKQDLFLIRLAKDLSTYEVDLSFEKVLKDIENRAFEASDSQIYQLYGSEVKIKESLPKEIAIIESYDSYSFIIVDAKNIQQIHNLRETYPWMDVSEDYTQRVIANNEHIMTYQKEQIVKFRYPVRQEWKQRLTNAGAKILKPLGGFEFVVSIPDRETLSKIQQFREVDSIYPYQPTIRVNEESLENLGAEVAPEMIVEAEQKITESYPVSSHRDNVIVGILIARFLTETDCDKAAQTLEARQIDIVDRPDIDMLIVDLLQHQNPKKAYEFLKSLSGLDTLEEETLATTLNSGPVPLLAKGPTMFEHIPNNLTGNGEIIAIADTGLDTGYEDVIHPDFRGRVMEIKSYPIKRSVSSIVHNPEGDDGAADKYSGHGTHVAGCAVGNGRLAQDSGLYPIHGIAHEAKLIFQALEQAPQWTQDYIRDYISTNQTTPPAFGLLGIPDNLRTLFQFAFDNGARIHSNSWGGRLSGHYNDQCKQLDKFVWENKDFLIVFAAGNEGNQRRGTVVPPGTAKNCLTVGTLDAFSSCGPCKDGRLKPDVVAPGNHILSTCSRYLGKHSRNAAPYPPAINHYVYMDGTSMATPLVAGCAALVRQFLRRGQQQRPMSNPSAALLKAALIHSAIHCPDYLSIVNGNRGWGKVQLDRIIQPTYRIEFLDQANGFTNSGQSHQYSLNITDNSMPLRISLVYTDHPGESLVNNLNLLVSSPQHSYYLGNDFNRQNREDRVNNVENCIINFPEAGRWIIKIIAGVIKEAPQDYALVISGNFADFDG